MTSYETLRSERDAGILTVTLNKAPEARPKRITVQAEA